MKKNIENYDEFGADYNAGLPIKSKLRKNKHRKILKKFETELELLERHQKIKKRQIIRNLARMQSRDDHCIF